MTAPKFKFPKTLGACADRLYELKQRRLEQQKVVDALKAEETALADHLIANLPKSEATGIAGKLVRAAVYITPTPQVEDWDEVYSYILRHAKKDPGVWALLQRRIGDAAVKEYWEAGREVPGVTHFNVAKVSLNKL